MAADPDAGPPEKGIPMTGRQGVKNILPNPSFEEATNPGMPDYYKLYYTKHRIGREDSLSGLTEENPVHGKICMRIHKPGRRSPNALRVKCTPNVPKATQFVFSAYLRSDREGAPVKMSAGSSEKWVTLTKEWKRYSLEYIIPPNAGRYFGTPTISVGKRKGEWAVNGCTVWADALQAEVGAAPTNFTP